jgi:hypothetical protein
MKFLPMILPLFLIAGCVDMTAETSLVEENQLSFPAPPAAAAGLPVSVDQIATLDIANVVDELQTHGELHLVVSQNSLQGDISFLNHIELDLTSPGFPDLVLVDTDVSSSSTNNNFPLLVSGDQMLPMLAANPCGLYFTITGTIPTDGASLVSTLVLNVSEEVRSL